MKQFEYKTIDFCDSETIQDSEMNKLGKDGWELIVVEKIELGTRFYFKREKN